MNFDGKTIAAFLLALAGFGYLLGPELGSNQFLIAFFLAAAVAVAVSWWLRPRPGEESGDALSLVFDVRATRRAVRRGIARSALAALIWVVLGFWVLSILTDVWQNAGSRNERFGPVLGNAFLVANPGYRHQNYGSTDWFTDVGFRSLELDLTVSVRTAAAVTPSTPVRLRLNLLGRLIRPSPLAPTPIDDALGREGGGRPDHQATVRLLQQLPPAITAIAIIEFRRPLAMRDFGAFLRTIDRRPYYDPFREDIPILVENPYRFRSASPTRSGHLRRALVWPRPSMAEFQTWAKKLHSDDDGSIGNLGLPPVSAIRNAAAEARVYGFILKATKRRIEQLVANPLVRSVLLADVAFDLEQNALS